MTAMKPDKTNRNDRRKRAIIEKKRLQQRNFAGCYAKTGFNVSKTCRIIGITRSTFLRWLKTDERFEEMIEAAKEERTDLAESILLANMQDNNKFVSNAATIFYLKTQGKKKGWSEKQEIDINVNQKRSKEEIDAIVEASLAADNIIIDAKILPQKRIEDKNEASD
jgi:transposase-like protein